MRHTLRHTVKLQMYKTKRKRNILLDFFYKDWHWILKSCLFAERKTGTGSEWKQQLVNTIECAWKKQRQEGARASGAQREWNRAFILPMICKSNLSTGHLQAVCWIWRQTGGCEWTPVSQALEKPFLWCQLSLPLYSSAVLAAAE